MARRVPRNGSLSAKQLASVRALIDADSVEAAAKAVGIRPNTLRQWLRDGAFSAEYDRARHEIMRHSILRLQVVVDDAVGALRSICLDSSVTASTRVSASKVILDQLVRMEELLSSGGNETGTCPKCGATSHHMTDDEILVRAIEVDMLEMVPVALIERGLAQGLITAHDAERARRRREALDAIN